MKKYFLLLCALVLGCAGLWLLVLKFHGRGPNVGGQKAENHASTSLAEAHESREPALPSRRPSGLSPAKNGASVRSSDSERYQIAIVDSKNRMPAQRELVLVSREGGHEQVERHAVSSHWSAPLHEDMTVEVIGVVVDGQAESFRASGIVARDNPEITVWLEPIVREIRVLSSASGMNLTEVVALTEAGDEYWRGPSPILVEESDLPVVLHCGAASYESKTVQLAGKSPRLQVLELSPAGGVRVRLSGSAHTPLLEHFQHVAKGSLTGTNVLVDLRPQDGERKTSLMPLNGIPEALFEGVLGGPATISLSWPHGSACYPSEFWKRELHVLAGEVQNVTVNWSPDDVPASEPVAILVVPPTGTGELQGSLIVEGLTGDVGPGKVSVRLSDFQVDEAHLRYEMRMPLSSVLTLSLWPHEVQPQTVQVAEGLQCVFDCSGASGMYLTAVDSEGLPLNRISFRARRIDSGKIFTRRADKAEGWSLLCSPGKYEVCAIDERGDQVSELVQVDVGSVATRSLAFNDEAKRFEAIVRLWPGGDHEPITMEWWTRLKVLPVGHVGEKVRLSFGGQGMQLSYAAGRSMADYATARFLFSGPGRYDFASREGDVLFQINVREGAGHQMDVVLPSSGR
ncbi:MAG: hypothetical protein WD226_11875 [Planctomycetota bacterium]